VLAWLVNSFNDQPSRSYSLATISRLTLVSVNAYHISTSLVSRQSTTRSSQYLTIIALPIITLDITRHLTKRYPSLTEMILMRASVVESIKNVVWQDNYLMLHNFIGYY
jgi:hypothetical protein